MTVSHPAIDSGAGDVIVTETRATIAYLSRSRSDLLATASGHGRTVALVSDEVTRLTFPMREALRRPGRRWVVRGLDGTLRDGLDGRLVRALADAGTNRPLTSADEIADRYARSAFADSVQLVITYSARHRAEETTLLGATAEALALELTGAAPAGWGLHEPAVAAWDRVRLTELSRQRMPSETVTVVAGAPGRPLVGTITAAWTAEGLEETTRLLVGVGAPGGDEARSAIAALPSVFARLGAHEAPLLALVLGRAGRRDLTFPSVREAPPTPLGLLVGPPAVPYLRLPREDLVAGLDTRVIGPPGASGLYFPLGTLEQDGWSALDTVLDAVGHENLAALGTSAAPLEEVLRGARP
ncbi:DUF6177 family protein [Cellulomonas sp. URHE0023]|uniref:DUF6177 family protein n=1 Tax=Cellulomonas sp. URHE0023 TaxID=1380354 RepID=UPI000482A0CA|nr:DUF6177 family protein [Cellulomonas sp. URHE0023]